MGERTSYAPGTFCWADLATTDVAGATAFYTALMGWDAEAIPIGDGVTYTLMRIGGRDVCGLSAMPEEQRALGAPPAWLSHVSVDDADAVAERAVALGGTLVAPPFDVLDAGRLALLQDPQGAHFGVWQARRQIGARLVNDPGAMCLNQLNTSDPDAGSRFYGELFGWEIDQVSPEPQAYLGIRNAGALNGGMMALEPGSPAPPSWLVYFTSADLEASAAAIAAGHGQVVVPPTPVPGGRFLVARDPQGAYFGLLAGRMDP